MNHILLTIDVEDWFQVENFKEFIPYSSWSSYELRVEKNTHRLLDLLDSVKLQHPVSGIQYPASNIKNPASRIHHIVSPGNQPHTTHNIQEERKTSLRRPAPTLSLVKEAGRRIGLSQFHPSGAEAPTGRRQETENKPKQMQSGRPSKSCLRTPKATFFILGWIAERLPHLVREIHSRGHEVASHGYGHDLCSETSPEDLKSDLEDSKKILEDITGNRVYGYRAPSFSVNNNILKTIEECGYQYDSSFNHFDTHGRYGQIDLSQNIKNGIAVNISETFYELPISNIRLGNRILPWGGGGYFRLIPFPIFWLGVQSILKKNNAYLFYIHPWEVDPEQPKVNRAATFYKFRHYFNLKNTHTKLSRLLQNFNESRFMTCHQYLQEINQRHKMG